MNFADIDLIAEVRRNREELLRLHGSIEKLHSHMKEDRPQLELEGWKFVSLDEVLAKKRRQA